MSLPIESFRSYEKSLDGVTKLESLNHANQIMGMLNTSLSNALDAHQPIINGTENNLESVIYPFSNVANKMYLVNELVPGKDGVIKTQVLYHQSRSFEKDIPLVSAMKQSLIGFYGGPHQIKFRFSEEDVKTGKHEQLTNMFNYFENLKQYTR